MTRALVLGLGRSGKAARALLCSKGMEVVALDKDDAFPSAGGVPFAFAVVSPGIALDHPWIGTARERGIPLKSELQLGCEELNARGVRLLAVTGSKGKSSVVKLVADALTATGASAVACGNYGLPVTEVALSGAVDWAVVEVSSFMMETTLLSQDTFEAATILNLQEDHLDRHGSVEVYHALKRNSSPLRIGRLLARTFSRTPRSSRALILIMTSCARTARRPSAFCALRGFRMTKFAPRSAPFARFRTA